MNLKESFRYQNFLNELMDRAAESVQAKNHCLNTTKIHKRKATNPEAEDIIEEVKCSDTFYPNDEVIEFMKTLIEEKRLLSEAIGEAKAGIDFDLDAEVETNKQRQYLTHVIKCMLRYTPSINTETCKDYKFNAEGNQMPYFYNVDVVTTEAFSRPLAKETMKKIAAEADMISAKIDAAMVNAVVNYTPPYDINDSFEDVMAEFAENIAK